MPDIAGLFCIQEMAVGFIETQVRGQMHVNAVCPHTVPENGFYNDVALVEGVNKVLFCQYHVLGFSHRAGTRTRTHKALVMGELHTLSPCVAACLGCLATRAGIEPALGGVYPCAFTLPGIEPG